MGKQDSENHSRDQVDSLIGLVKENRSDEPKMEEDIESERPGKILIIDYKKEAGWAGWYTLLKGADIKDSSPFIFFYKEIHNTLIKTRSKYQLKIFFADSDRVEVTIAPKGDAPRPSEALY